MLPRSQAPRLAGRLLVRCLRNTAFTQWYVRASITMERQVLRAVLQGEHELIHALWADHDLGYLDLLLPRSRLLVGTFHSGYHDLSATIRFPARLRRFAAIILMSRSQRRFFVERGVPDSRLFVVLHGVDTEFFQPAPRRSDRFVALSVGGHRRNFALLRNLCIAAQDNKRILFQIVAPSVHAPMFADLPNAQFLSGISRDALRESYQQASCMLLTVEDSTANNGLLEAMACGLPIVAERIGGIPEYVNDEAAILTEPGDAEGLATAISRLAVSECLRDEMGCAARQRAKQLDWSCVAKATTDVYGLALGGS